ncbi:MAG: Asp-tRNA(Asn)/Glu-tRNA(Gln) amidotransferase subunit GatA, partial [Phycisphaerae bacterium]
MRAGRCSAVEAVQRCLGRIERLDGVVRAFISVDGERALGRAEQIDRRLARGEPVGALAGVPVAVKDNICTRFGYTTCASKILANFASPYDATVVERLEAAGAIIVGKTNLDEFAMGSSTENSGMFVTRNPWRSEYVPGGSSGGSAAAVAARMVPAAIGSDTGGSIRQPAAFCGVTGLKPTYGRVSRYGLVAYGSSLDQIGPITQDVADAALLLGVIAGHDRRDSTCIDAPVPDYLGRLSEPLGPVRIGVAREYFGEGLDGEVRQAIEQALEVYRQGGAEIVEVSLPHSEYAIAAYYLIAMAEASSNLARYDGVHYGYRTARPEDFIDLYCTSRAEGFGPEVKRRIMLGTYALSSGYYEAYYLKALKVRTLIRRDFDRAFERFDVLLSPTSPTVAFKIGERADDPLAMKMADICTIPVNLAGIPALSVPCGFSEGLPVGLQIMGKPFDEETILRVGYAYEQQGGWAGRKPPLSQQPSEARAEA